MKKIILILVISIGFLFIIQSCKKDDANKPTSQTITKNLTINETFQYDLGGFGDEEGASISKQANNYSVSFVDRNINTDKVIYKYTPALNFVGIDEVEIKSSGGSDGASPNNKINYTIIKFIIN
ncbi:MAG: hypothetical protein NTZ41_02295 [Sphingobacteriales bacterium]|jgi:hypothetical protein|nr:hypothetical protein [Sphingobacteriales bacterium]